LQNDGNINKIPPKTQRPKTPKKNKKTRKQMSRKPSLKLSIILSIVFIVLSIILLALGLTTKEKEIAIFFYSLQAVILIALGYLWLPDKLSRIAIRLLAFFFSLLSLAAVVLSSIFLFLHDEPLKSKIPTLWVKSMVVFIIFGIPNFIYSLKGYYFQKKK
jgi:heme/copper-type cytochrome/quinol oxidase subunit 4